MQPEYYYSPNHKCDETALVPADIVFAALGDLPIITLSQALESRVLQSFLNIVYGVEYSRIVRYKIHKRLRIIGRVNV